MKFYFRSSFEILNPLFVVAAVVLVWDLIFILSSLWYRGVPRVSYVGKKEHRGRNLSRAIIFVPLVVLYTAVFRFIRDV